MSKAEEYIRARLAGLSSHAAAREAGFVGARPSPRARAMWKRVQALRETPGLAEALAVERSKLAAQTTRLAPVQASHRIWSEVLSLLERESKKTDSPH